MHERQINPIGRPEGGTNLLGAILTRVGIVAIVLVGVLIAPTGLPDLSRIVATTSPTASATSMPEADLAKWPTPRQALEQTSPSKVIPAVWISEEQVRPDGHDDLEATPSVEGLEKDTMHWSASRPTDEQRPRTMFQKVCRKLKDGLQRLGGFVVARGFHAPSDHQRIPASFIPSRS
ncbi:MAG: hypothetical protein CMJ67_06035 [Planctomycetaceae bacterium]|nr:hypothetical protein [Planctomycetaceae bacterium]